MHSVVNYSAAAHGEVRFGQDYVAGDGIELLARINEVVRGGMAGNPRIFERP